MRSIFWEKWEQLINLNRLVSSYVIDMNSQIKLIMHRRLNHRTRLKIEPACISVQLQVVEKLFCCSVALLPMRISPKFNWQYILYYKISPGVFIPRAFFAILLIAVITIVGLKMGCAKICLIVLVYINCKWKLLNQNRIFVSNVK